MPCGAGLKDLFDVLRGVVRSHHVNRQLWAYPADVINGTDAVPGPQP